MYYNTQTYIKLRAQRKHKLFIYSMLLALLLLFTNIGMDYFLTGHLPVNALITIIPVCIFLLTKHFSSFDQGVYRVFYLVFIITIIQAILYSRPEHTTTTYWAYLIIIAIFTYEDTLKNSLIILVGMKLRKLTTRHC